MDQLHLEPTAGARLVPCWFRAGVVRSFRNGQLSVGKGYLVRRLEALLADRRIVLPETAEAEALFHELQVYERRVDARGTVRYGAFRPGTHDDLVTALALAVQGDA